MILSASGWRKVFARSGNEEDKTTSIGETNKVLCILIAQTFAQYLIAKTKKKFPTVTVGMDTRPTGKEISDCILRTFAACGLKVHFLGISSAPEIMAYSRQTDGFLYISASHNPIGHNGIKFGLNDGGVVPGSEAKVLADSFNSKVSDENAETNAKVLINSAKEKDIAAIYKKSDTYKKAALKAYTAFIQHVITGTESPKEQKSCFKQIKDYLKANPLDLVCDMNGSSRILSIDKTFIPSTGLGFTTFNDQAGNIVHAIIPEPENLIHTKAKMEELQSAGNKAALLGFMPDCDGDRGNIVFWNEKENSAQVLKAQEVFALCVTSELAFELWKKPEQKNLAVAVNCPTSMRIDEICSAFGAKLFRAEVGEANVVNLARKKRLEDYNVRILGEGSNGGNITNPSCVRDPVASIFALVKLLTVRDTYQKNGDLKKGLFHLWCSLSGQEEKYRDEFTLADIIQTLPIYTTTGVSEDRALLKVDVADKGLLKEKFRTIFEKQYQANKAQLLEKYKIASYVAVTTNGTEETENPESWNNGNGGLKIKFLNSEEKPIAFIWMRPSGTENVFRIMCDVKGNKPMTEKSLLQWESNMIAQAVKMMA